MTENRINITQGEHATGAAPDQVITTLLGSCVSACLWDPVAQVGGMNHMLLAVSETDGVACDLAGVNAMEILINDMIKQGAKRDRLQAKVFGGAQMVSGLSDIGRKNAEFTLSFLEAEGITVVSQSIGGTLARNLRFWPTTGKAQQRMSSSSVAEKPAPKPVANDMELF